MTDIELSYKGGTLCGNCLHHKNSHAFFKETGCYHCAACSKICDPETYSHTHKGGNVIVDQTNKVRYEMPDKKERKAIAPAPLDLSGK